MFLPVGICKLQLNLQVLLIFGDIYTPFSQHAGTVIDNAVCHPQSYDFYMCAHAGMIVSFIIQLSLFSFHTRISLL